MAGRGGYPRMRGAVVAALVLGLAGCSTGAPRTTPTDNVGTPPRVSDSPSATRSPASSASAVESSAAASAAPDAPSAAARTRAPEMSPGLPPPVKPPVRPKSPVVPPRRDGGGAGAPVADVPQNPNRGPTPPPAPPRPSPVPEWTDAKWRPGDPVEDRT